MNNLISHLEELEKEEKAELKVKQRKEININAEINEIETRKIMGCNPSY
jgi:hypothetical protein